MKLIILGSGGFQTIPRPTCQCSVCAEARKKGVPYSRNGPSIFIEDINAIIDTPKDIINSVNRENIKKIERVFFTHWHPDHTEGMRIVEEINCDWTEKKPYIIENPGKPIALYAPREVLTQLKSLSTPFGSYFDFYEKKRYLGIHELEFDEAVKIGNLNIKPVKLVEGKTIGTVYLIYEKNKKVAYFPCEAKACSDYSFLLQSDILIINSPWLSPLSKGQKLGKDHLVKQSCLGMDELIKIIIENKIKKTTVIHIEEMWGRSRDDYKKLEKKYAKYNIKFAFDGMKIEV